MGTLVSKMPTTNRFAELFTKTKVARFNGLTMSEKSLPLRPIEVIFKVHSMEY